jgi:hypothetical protein
MASVTWDKQRLADEIKSLQGIADGAFQPRLAQLIAAGGVKLTMDTFRNQRDPYGTPWAPLARERSRDKRARLRREAKGLKARGQKILIRTARMRNSTTAIANGRSGGVAIPVGYAAAHQNGAHISPHSRLASYQNVTYRVGNRFATEAQARKARRAGQTVVANRFARTFASGITIPQRMMLPSADRGLPGTWQHMIQRETIGLLTRWANKGARA